MKTEQGKVNVAIIIVIMILVIAVIFVLGFVAYQLFQSEKQPPQYVMPDPVINNVEDPVANYVGGNNVGSLGTSAKSFTYCTTPNCGIVSDTHLHLGDRILYDPTKLKEGALETSLTYTSYSTNTGAEAPTVTFDARSTDKINEWYVIGEENGQILLLAGTTTGNTLELKGSVGVVNGVYEMEKICRIYENGVGAESATSLSLEKLNQLAGMKVDLENKQVVYRDGSSIEYLFNYGNEVDYSKNSSKDKKEHTDPWTAQGQIIPVSIATYITSKSPLKVKSGYYGYSLANPKVAGNDMGLAKIKLGLGKDYWLSTIGMNADEMLVRYGPAGVASNNIVVSAIDLFSSTGTENKGSFYVRPIVRLSPKVTTEMVKKVIE